MSPGKAVHMNKLSKLSGILCAAAALTFLCGSVQAEPRMLEPERIAASSTLTGDAYSHDCYCVNDNDLSTAWVEGVSGNGEGQFVDLFYPAGTLVTGGVIYPGYYKNQDVFEKNSAVTRIQLQSANQFREVDTSAGALTWQKDFGGVHFTLDEPIVCEGTLRVRIMEVRSGWKYTDTCISEVHFETDDAETSRHEFNPADPGGETTGSTEQDEDDQSSYTLTHLAGWIYRQRHADLKEPAEDTIRVEDLTAEEKAFILYWYQYNISDPRIEQKGEYNYLADGLLRKILIEIFGKATMGDRQAFYDNYVEEVAKDNVCAVGATGDFGDAGPFYFLPDGPTSMDGDRVLVTGFIMTWNDAEQDYVRDLPFKAWYYQNDEEAGWDYRFDEIQVGGAYA